MSSTLTKQMNTDRAYLTERDTEVMLDIYKYRYLSVSQIKRLHFPSLQTAYRRLRSLTAGGLISLRISQNISTTWMHGEQS